jgi:release factor family 2
MEQSTPSPSGALRPEDLASLSRLDGPLATVYLATDAAVENAAQRSIAEWRALRSMLLDQGAPEHVAELIDPLVPDAHLHGQTLAVIAGPEGVHHLEHHPELPRRQHARWGSVPSLLPMLEWRQSLPPHVVVLTDRAGADIVATGAGTPDRDAEAGGNADPLARSKPGGWSQRRYQQRAENTWEQNARDVAAEVERLSDAVDARLVVVAGDVRAVELLRSALPRRIEGMVVEVEGSRAADGSEETVAREVRRMVATAAARQTVEVLRRFSEERGRQDLASDGAAATVEALREARVDVLLVEDRPDDDRTAWFGSAPTTIALTEADARAAGATDVRRGPLIDAAVRAAFGTGAAVRVTPSGARGPHDGLGAILRWRLPAMTQPG